MRYTPPDEATTKKMRAVRRSGTSPESAVRDLLQSMGIDFTTNVKGKPGSPDIWLTESDVPIFVHGCFWHRHENCKKASLPKKNREFWIEKFEKNRERDSRFIRQLEDMGYHPIVVWQCETVDLSVLKGILIDRTRNTVS